MSLNRAQWIEMWESIKRIEYRTGTRITFEDKRLIMGEIEKIKQQIQSVIGQME